MNVRFAAPALLLVVTASAPTYASILSASNSAAHVHSQSVDYLSVTAVQDGLNASLTDQTRISSAGALGGTFSPSSSNGGFLVTTMGTSGDGSGGSIVVGSFSGGAVGIPSRYRANIRVGKDGNSAGGISQSHRGSRGGVQAAPEPSTWLLLGTSLGMIGFYAAMRRRRSVSI